MYCMTAGQSGNRDEQKWMNPSPNRSAPLVGQLSIRKSPRLKSLANPDSGHAHERARRYQNAPT